MSDEPQDKPKDEIPVDIAHIRGEDEIAPDEEKLSPREIRMLVTEEPQAEQKAPEGWITLAEFGIKYGFSLKKVTGLCVHGRLIFRKFGHQKYILDIPINQHPMRPEDRLDNARLTGKPKKIMKRPELEERRKKLLREKFLPKFLEKAPPDRMFFSSKEVQEIFGINQPALHRDWKRWGLVSREAPEDYKHLSDVDVRGAHVYARRDLYRFLTGDWGPPEKGTPDDIIIGAASGAQALDGAYYKYDPANVFPLTAEGFFQWLKDVDLKTESKRLRKWVSYTPWPIQREAITEALTLKDNGDFKHKIAIFSAPRGEGKCQKRGTKLIGYDGKIVKVEDVRVDDLLMGPDSRPRRVLALGRGTDEMYEVVPVKGESFTVNGAHILALQQRIVEEDLRKRGGKRQYAIRNITISVDEYRKQNRTFKETTYLYRVPINWPEQSVAIDPYFLGLWLADGDSNKLTITESDADTEIFEFLHEFASRYDCVLHLYHDTRTKALRASITNGNSRLLRESFENHDLFGNKHIPLDYKANSRDIRLQLLAGLIDGDGYRNRTGYVIVQKSKELADDIAFISRSLGFFAQARQFKGEIKSIGFEGVYYKIYISGNCSEIPLKLKRKKAPPRKINKDVLRTRIKEIRPVGRDEYYGFTLDGDSLYLLEDFTVTHNTLLVCVLTLFFFFNGYSEVITLAGNSKDQSKFTHYDLCKAIIQHTPRLIKTPGLEVKEKYIALKTGPKEMFNYMQAIPTSVGLLPGTTRAIFTELHNLQEFKFFYDLWTSLRNVPNAMVLVDTTVARPGHLVHNLWKVCTSGEDPAVYFHHYADKHYNPEMTADELHHFRTTLPEPIYNMYFRNRWEDAAGALFPDEKIRETGVCGLDNKITLPSPEIVDTITQLAELNHKRNGFIRGQMNLADINREIALVESRLYPVDRLYRMPAKMVDLEMIGKAFNCNFVVGVGLDRALRLKKHPGRTVMSAVARGFISEELSLYFILDIFVPKESTFQVLTEKFTEWNIEYGWIDKVVVETYSSEDFYEWVSDKALAAEFVAPTFSKQKPVFFSMSNIVDNGLLKCPRVPYYTDEKGVVYKGFSNKDDIFREEMGVFTYKPGLTEKNGSFGSPDKDKKSGVQDDTMYSVAWAIYGTHGEGVRPIGSRTKGFGAIQAIINQDTVGTYR